MAYPNQYVSPYGYQPYQSYMAQQQQPQQPIHGFVYVNGIEGAKAYQMPPNSEMPLFDQGGDILYIKVTDGAGFPTITVVDCKRREQGMQEPSAFVTRDEMQHAYNDLSRQLEKIKESMNVTVSAATGTGDERQAGDAGKPEEARKR